MRRYNLYHAFITLINTYSIWVVVGSFSMYLFFSHVFEVTPNYVVGIGLSLGLWVIYTLDHIFDGVKLRDKASSIRHLKHYDQQRPIVFALIIALSILVTMAFQLSTVYYGYVFGLFILTVIHFLMNHIVSIRIASIRFLKEAFIALVVSIGFVYTPLVEINNPMDWVQFFCLFSVICALNFSNLLIFSLFDRKSDYEDKMLSLAHFLSSTTLKSVIYVSLGGSFLFLCLTLFFGYLIWVEFFVILAMQLSLGWIVYRYEYYQDFDKYRFYGDFIYVYPLVVWPFLY